MKTKIQRPIVSLIALTTLLAGAIVPTSMAAQKDSRLEGVWDSQVTLTDCQSGNIIAKFRAFEMHQHDGTMTDTGAAPGDPTSRGPGLGTWGFVGGPNGQTYTAVFRFFRFNPDELLPARRWYVAKSSWGSRPDI